MAQPCLSNVNNVFDEILEIISSAVNTHTPLKLASKKTENIKQTLAYKNELLSLSDIATSKNCFMKDMQTNLPKSINYQKTLF